MSTFLNHLVNIPEVHMRNALDRLCYLLASPMSNRMRKFLDWFCYLFVAGMTLFFVDWFITELAR
jgi:hypothetical protein